MADGKLPVGFRQGIVTAITVLLGFSLSFLRFWSFETHGEWTWRGVVPAGLLAAGIFVQLVALHHALDLRRGARALHDHRTMVLCRDRDRRDRRDGRRLT
jgi:uncharacterized membrane protein